MAPVAKKTFELVTNPGGCGVTYSLEEKISGVWGPVTDDARAKIDGDEVKG